MDLINDKQRIGICIDTCHSHSSGLFKLDTYEAVDNMLNEVDKVIGLKYLKGIHLNDSKTEFNSHKDRHDNIGKGTIPLTVFNAIMNDNRLNDIPLILETPIVLNDPTTTDQAEVKMLYDMIKS